MRSRLGVIWDFLRGQRLRYAGALAAMCLGIGIGYLSPLVCKAALDGAICGKPVALPGWASGWLEGLGGIASLRDQLWAAAAALLVLAIVGGACGYFRGRWSATAAEAVARSLREKLYDHLQHLPCAYHDKANPGDLVQRCTADVEKVRMFLAMQVVDLGRGVMMLAIGLPMMLSLDVWMTLVSLAVVPPVVTFSFVFYRWVRGAFKLEDEAEGELTTRLQESLSGIRVVRAFARQDLEIRKFAAKNDQLRDRTFKLYRLMSWYWSCSDLMCMLSNGLVLLVGAWRVTQDTLTIGTLYAFLAYTMMFIWPVRMMGRILTDMGKTHVSLGRLHEILDSPVEPDVPALPGEPTPGPELPATLPDGRRVRGELEIAGLSFSYGDGDRPDVLRQFTLAIPAGRTLALLGPSGSGKSTLVHLLLRLYDYRRGSIRLDGCELRSLPRKFVRAQIASVLQDPFLFSRNLRENIRLGRTEASEEEIQGAAEGACIHDSIVSFEKGYDTVIGERGVTLSGGQRQRVALARALVRQPAVLILDDALSSVDTRTEQMILETLCARRGLLTTIIIAHRLTTLMQSDWVVVLEAGAIAQQGPHEILVREPGLYSRLWQIQGALEEDLRK